MDDMLNIREASDVVGSPMGMCPWTKTILQPAGLDSIEFRYTNAVEKAKCRNTDVVATKLELGGATYSVCHPLFFSLGVCVSMCQSTQLSHDDKV